jgi:hypothetical protein
MNILAIVCILMLYSCHSSEVKNPSRAWQTILSRDEPPFLDRVPLYRIKAPEGWERIDAKAGESLIDTTKALCEFYIRDPEGFIRIAIHNFPSEAIEDRISPDMQIARWKKQIGGLNPLSLHASPQSFSGYVGKLLEGQGENQSIMGWSMQIGVENYSRLQGGTSEAEQALFRQKRGDVTIKATGPVALMEKHRFEIAAFARSFELIDEIPWE